MKMTNSNKITNTKVGDDIHFYVNGSEDRGIVVKMNNEYVTVFKESTQEYDDIHINDTFFIKDILVNKEWDKMDDDERYDALKKIHAPSPRFIMKSWNELPKEIKELLTKNNAIETSHKEGKDDDMNNTTRVFDDSKKGLGGTERKIGDGSTQGGDTGEGRDAQGTGAETKGEDATQHAGDKVQGKKHKKQPIETNPETKPDTHGHGERGETKEEEEGHTRVTGRVEDVGTAFTTSGGAAQAELDRQTEESLGSAAQNQQNLADAKRVRGEINSKVAERKERKENTSTKVPKKVTDAMSKHKAWQLWLAKREQEVLKESDKKRRVPESPTVRSLMGSVDEANRKREAQGAEGRIKLDKPTKKKSFYEQWLEDKSNTERSIHGNAGREPNSGVNTNTGFDAPKDYEGFSHSGVRPEQFKHEKLKPKVTTKERINIGSTAPSQGGQGTGDGGNPHNTRQQNKDVKGRAV